MTKLTFTQALEQATAVPNPKPMSRAELFAEIGRLQKEKAKLAVDLAEAENKLASMSQYVEGLAHAVMRMGFRLQPFEQWTESED